MSLVSLDVNRFDQSSSSAGRSIDRSSNNAAPNSSSNSSPFSASDSRSSQPPQSLSPSLQSQQPSYGGNAPPQQRNGPFGAGGVRYVPPHMRAAGGKSPAGAPAVSGNAPAALQLEQNGSAPGAAYPPQSVAPASFRQGGDERNGRYASDFPASNSSHPPSILSAQFAPPPSSANAANYERFGARDVRAGDYSRSSGPQSSSHDVRFGSSNFSSSVRRAAPSLQRDSRKELELFGPEVDKPRAIEFKNYEDIPVETSGLDVPPPIDGFKQLQAHEVLLSNIDLSGYDKPTPVQRYAMPISMAGRDLMACAQTGSGKCWAAGTLLRLHSGALKPVEQFRGGELLMGDDGCPRVVTAGSVTQGEAVLYRIAPLHDGAAAFTVNGDHILVLLNTAQPSAAYDQPAGSWAVSWYEVDADNRMQRRQLSCDTKAAADAELSSRLQSWSPLLWEVTVDDFLKTAENTARLCQLFQSAAVTFDSPQPRLQQRLSGLLRTDASPAQTAWAAWYLGLWLAQGHSGSDRVAHADGDVVQHLMQYETLFAEPVTAETDDAGVCWYQFGRRSGSESEQPSIAHRLLQAFGLLDNQHVLHACLCDEIDVRRRLLAGVIDGCGRYEASNGFELSSAHRSVLDGCKELAGSLGIRSSAVKLVDGQHRLSVSGDVAEVAQWCQSAALRCAVEYGSKSLLLLQSRCYGFTVSALPAGRYYGFAVHGGSNRRFLLADFTVTHNTAAFLLPMIGTILAHNLHLRQPPSERGGNFRSRRACPSALVLAPTRELATQIYNEARKFVYRTGLQPVVVYGGQDIRNQLREIERGVDILVATPGRLVDFLERGRISLSMIEFLVFDEADRMLDMGFEPQIRQIVSGSDMAHEQRQTLMFSATFPKEIQRLAQDFLKNYVFLAVGRVGSTTDFITQKVEYSGGRDNEKLDRLMQILSTCEGLTLIFVETKRGADSLEHQLQQEGIEATSIHGDRTQQERENALQMFRCGRCPVLVATDVASRGLDIPDVRCVPEHDTRVLTDAGYLFLSEIEERLAAGETVLYACYEEATQSIVYCSGELVIAYEPGVDDPAAAPTRWVDFTQAATRRLWDGTSDDYGSTEAAGGDRANRLTLRTTPNHEMYVQLCAGGRCGGDGKPWVEPRQANRAPIPPQKVYAEELAPGYQCDCFAAGRVCTHGYSHYRMYTGAAAGLQVSAANVIALANTDPASPVVALGLRTEDELDAFLELFGYWLGDGTMSYRTTTGYNAVKFAPKKQRDRGYLMGDDVQVGLLNRLHLVEGVHYNINDSAAALQVWVYAPSWFRFFDSEFGVKYARSSRYDPRLALIKQGMHSSQRRPAAARGPDAASRTRSRASSGCSGFDGDIALSDDSGDDDEEEDEKMDVPVVKDEDEVEPGASADEPIDLTVSDDDVKRDDAERPGQVGQVAASLGATSAGRSAAAARHRGRTAGRRPLGGHTDAACEGGGGQRIDGRGQAADLHVERRLPRPAHPRLPARRLQRLLQAQHARRRGARLRPRCRWTATASYTEAEMKAALQKDTTRAFKAVRSNHDNWWACYKEVTSETLLAQDVRFDGRDWRAREKRAYREGWVGVHAVTREVRVGRDAERARAGAVL